MRRRAPRRITASYLERYTLHYLERYVTTGPHLRRLLRRRVAKSSAHHEVDPAEGYRLVDALIVKLEDVGLINDRRYAGIDPALLPATESLKTTLARVEPYWQDMIVPALTSGKDVIVAAHGNSLRALVKMLDGISDEEITGLNIPTGIPILYDLDDDLNARGREFVGDPEAARKAAEAVARQASGN